MIIDAFTFFNELDLLEIRLMELDPYVDKFILCEADRTFQGQAKPFVYAQNSSARYGAFCGNINRFSKWARKIVWVPVRDMPESADAWAREAHQRNAIARAFDPSWPDSATVILSDVDEIPDLSDNWALGGLPTVWVQDLFYYYVNLWAGKWMGSCAVRLGAIRAQGLTMQDIRDSRGRALHKIQGGWHFSYMGGPEAIVEKLKAFSHTEFKELATVENARDAMESRWTAGLDLFYRDFYKFKLWEPESHLLPECLRLEKYRHLFSTAAVAV